MRKCDDNFISNKKQKIHNNSFQDSIRDLVVDFRRTNNWDNDLCQKQKFTQIYQLLMKYLLDKALKDWPSRQLHVQERGFPIFLDILFENEKTTYSTSPAHRKAWRSTEENFKTQLVVKSSIKIPFDPLKPVIVVHSTNRTNTDRINRTFSWCEELDKSQLEKPLTQQTVLLFDNMSPVFSDSIIHPSEVSQTDQSMDTLSWQHYFRDSSDDEFESNSSVTPCCDGPYQHILETNCHSTNPALIICIAASLYRSYTENFITQFNLDTAFKSFTMEETPLDDYLKKQIIPRSGVVRFIHLNYESDNKKSEWRNVVRSLKIVTKICSRAMIPCIVVMPFTIEFSTELHNVFYKYLMDWDDLGNVRVLCAGGNDRCRNKVVPASLVHEKLFIIVDREQHCLYRSEFTPLNAISPDTFDEGTSSTIATLNMIEKFIEDPEMTKEKLWVKDLKEVGHISFLKRQTHFHDHSSPVISPYIIFLAFCSLLLRTPFLTNITQWILSLYSKSFNWLWALVLEQRGVKLRISTVSMGFRRLVAGIIYTCIAVYLLVILLYLLVFMSTTMTTVSSAYEYATRPWISNQFYLQIRERTPSGEMDEYAGRCGYYQLECKYPRIIHQYFPKLIDPCRVTAASVEALMNEFTIDNIPLGVLSSLDVDHQWILKPDHLTLPGIREFLQQMKKKFKDEYIGIPAIFSRRHKLAAIRSWGMFDSWYFNPLSEPAWWNSMHATQFIL